MSEELPRSRAVRRPWWRSPFTLVPLAAAATVAWVFAHRAAEEGPRIEIVFDHAEGISAGETDLKFKGVKLGEVTRLRLHEDLEHVVAEVQLERSGEAFAREGAKFWVVRPQVSAGGIRALGTVVSGAYIAATPGKGAKKEKFKGLPEEPLVEAERKGLEIFVVTDQGSSMHEGAPVYYRGVKVGAVGETTLADHGRKVRTRVVIMRPYRRLVRANTKFWNAGGVQLHFGLLHGLDIDSKSLISVLEGGVALATPNDAGAPAKPGQEFLLEEKADDKWLKWNPSLPLGPQTPDTED